MVCALALLFAVSATDSGMLVEQGACKKPMLYSGSCWVPSPDTALNCPRAIWVEVHIAEMSHAQTNTKSIETCMDKNQNTKTTRVSQFSPIPPDQDSSTDKTAHSRVPVQSGFEPRGDFHKREMTGFKSTMEVRSCARKGEEQRTARHGLSLRSLRLDARDRALLRLLLWPRARGAGIEILVPRGSFGLDRCGFVGFPLGD